MSHAFVKEPASRPNVYQNVTWLTTTAGATGPKVCSNKFGTATQQIRIISQIPGWVSIDQSTGTTTVTSANIPGTGFFIPASTAVAEYFVVTPGQLLTFASTGNTTGIISITEMA